MMVMMSMKLMNKHQQGNRELHMRISLSTCGDKNRSVSVILPIIQITHRGACRDNFDVQLTWVVETAFHCHYEAFLSPKGSFRALYGIITEIS